MSNERSTQTAPNTLSLKDRVVMGTKIGMVVGGAYLGIFKGGAEKVGAEVGAPIDKGAHDAITTTKAVLTGVGEGIADVVGDNTPPADPARDRLNAGVAKAHGTPEIH